MKKIMAAAFASVLAVCLCLTSFVPATSAFAHPAPDELKTVKLGYMWGMNFQEGAEPDAPKSGLSYDYLQQIAAQAGWKYEYAYGSWEELYEKLEAGEIDIMSGISHTPEREEKINFPDLPITTENYFIFVPEDKQAQYPQLESLSGKTVGVSAETLTCERLKEWEEINHYGIKIVEFADDDARLEAFKNGTTDATADLDMQVGSGDGMVPVVQFGASNTYIGVAKNRTDVLDDLNNAISTINTTMPTFGSGLFRKYFSDTAVMSSLTAEESSWFAAHPTIVVGYLDKLAPFSETGADGKARGMNVDLLRYAFEHMGLSNELSFVAYQDADSLLADLHDGKIDVSIPHYGSAWNSEQAGILQSATVVSAKMTLFSASGKSVTDSTVFAVSDNAPVQESYVKEFYPNNKVIHCSTLVDAINTVRSGVADATMMNTYAASIYLRNDSTLNRVELGQTEDLGIAVAPGHVELLSVINRGISAWGEGSIQESLLTYADEAYAPTLFDFIRANAAAVNVGVLAALIILGLLISLVVLRGRQKKEAERHAHVDDMTGLLNRRSYEEAIARIDKAGAPKELVATVMDIDGLKSINDTLGHVAGDELIRGFAACLQDVLDEAKRQGITVDAYRTGGDEFVALSTMDKKTCDALLERFCKNVCSWKGTEVQEMTVSVGQAAKVDHPDATAMELVQIADAVMYEDKKVHHRARM